GRLRFPRRQLMPGKVVCARSITMPAGDNHAADSCRHPTERFARQTLFARAPVCRDPMFSQALRLMARRMRRGGVGEWVGVAIALVSSCLGGTAAAITRYLAGNTDPITLAILRWGIGFCCVLPAALLLKARWPRRGDWPAVAALGFCFFGVFFVLYNIAMSYTTAARASLALATLPLHTMVVGAILGIEPLTKRKSIGVCIAVLGVAAALATGLSAAPPGAWRGEL